MSGPPTPVSSGTPSPTSARTARSRADFSASVVVGDSPVVPLRTIPSQPSATRRAACARAASGSRAPVAVKGVIMAQSARPKGRGAVAVMSEVSAPGTVQVHLDLLGVTGKKC